MSWPSVHFFSARGGKRLTFFRMASGQNTIENWKRVMNEFLLASLVV